MCADNIINITFGVTSAFLTIVTIYLMCKHQKSSRDLDIEQGRDPEFKSIIPNLGPAPITPYSNLRSLPAEPDQAEESSPNFLQPNIKPEHPYGISFRSPYAQNQAPLQYVQHWPDTIEVPTMPELSEFHPYYRSLRDFISNELD